MCEIGRDVQRKAVERDPAFHAHAYRADLRLAPVRCVGPDADAPFGAAGLDPEQRQRVDHPAFERGDIGAYIAPAPRQVELDIADALARAVIGVSPAAARIIDRKARVEQLGGVGARPRRIERRMLEQPDALARVARMDRGGARLHVGERRVVRGQARRKGPFG